MSDVKAAVTGSSGMSLKFNEVPNYKPGMNVLDIEVPAHLERTVPSGVQFIDDAFGGTGLTPSSVTLFTGTPGSGKTTLLLQLANALTGKGHVCLYNTGEESLLQVRRTCKRLQMKHGFVPGNARYVDEVLAHANFLRARNPAKDVVLVIDSLQTQDDGFYDNGHTNSMTPVRVIERLTEWAKTTFGIVIVIGHVTKDGKLAGKQQIKHTVDVHAQLFIDEKPKSETYGKRIFKISKNRFGCNGLAYVLEMNGNGLVEEGSYSGEDDDEATELCDGSSRPAIFT